MFFFKVSLRTCFLFLKFTLSTFIIVSPKTILGFRTATVLFPALISLYKVYCIFGLAIKWSLSIFKVKHFFINLHNLQGGLFPLNGQELPPTRIIGKTDLPRGSLSFLNRTKGIPVKTFSCSSSGACKIYNSSKKFLVF